LLRFQHYIFSYTVTLDCMLEVDMIDACGYKRWFHLFHCFYHCNAISDAQWHSSLLGNTLIKHSGMHTGQYIVTSIISNWDPQGGCTCTTILCIMWYIASCDLWNGIKELLHVSLIWSVPKNQVYQLIYSTTFPCL